MRKVKFVATDPAQGGLPVKRKQVQQACDDCRKRKKRCTHVLDSEPDAAESHNGRRRSEGSSDSGAGHGFSVFDTRRPSEPTPSPSLPPPPLFGISQDRGGGTSSSHGSPGLARRETQPLAASHRRSSSLAQQPQSSRFVCDMNPEGMFMEASGSTENARKGNVGIWLSHHSPTSTTTTTTTNAAAASPSVAGLGAPPTWTSRDGETPSGTDVSAGGTNPAVEQSSNPTSTAASSSSTQFLISGPPPVLDAYMIPWVRQHCLTCVPPPATFRVLRRIYAERIQPIFPVLTGPVLATDDPDFEASEKPADVLMKQLLCLAAGADPESFPHLRLEHVPGVTPGQHDQAAVLAPKAFSRHTSSAVRALLETSLISDRVMHIRALAMLSFYFQPAGPSEADLPAQLSSRAVYHMFILGLHLMRYEVLSPPHDHATTPVPPSTHSVGYPRPNPSTQHQSLRPNPAAMPPMSSDLAYLAELETLFLVIWALDRINAAMVGAPVNIHERDISVNIEASIARQKEPCFRLLLKIVIWLDSVTELYRPGPSAAASGCERTAYIDLPVLEAMIVEAGALDVSSSLIATVETFYHAVIILSCRLSRPGTKSAASTLPPPSANARRSLAAERIADAVPRDRLSPLPFVPYSLSLALSVEYRKMRHSRLPMFRRRAMAAFRRNCELLRDLSQVFWTAEVMAGLAEGVLREMEKVVKDQGQQLQGREEGERNATIPRNGAAPLQPHGNGAFLAAAGDTPTSLTTVRSPPVATRAGPRYPGDSSNHSYTPATGCTGATTSGDQHQPPPQQLNASLADFSLADAVAGGQDLFGHIDPSFDLGAVEDVLEANLDIGMPLNLNWGEFNLAGV